MVTTLAAAPGLRVEDYRCDGRSASTDERIDGFELVFVRRGAFQVESARGRALADAQSMLLFHRGEQFRVTHPANCGDHCLIVGFDESLLADLFSRTPLLDDGRPEAPFAALHVACPPGLHAAALRLAKRLVAQGGDPLLAAEELAPLVARALETAPVAESASRRESAEASDLAEAVRLALARRLGDRLPLAELAAPLGVSPYHLARVFRRQTGTSIHQYRLELRLREAFGRLLAGERDLTGLALDLGFADHAHFTNAFRRRFGLPPSRARGERRQAIVSAPRPRRRPPGAA